MSPPPIQIFPFEVHCNHFSTKNTLFSSDIVSVFFLNLVFYTVKKLFFPKFRRLHNFKYGLILTLWCQLWTRTGAFPAFAEFELCSILRTYTGYNCTLPPCGKHFDERYKPSEFMSSLYYMTFTHTLLYGIYQDVN